VTSSHRSPYLAAGIAFLLAILAATAFLSLTNGSRSIPLAEVLDAFRHFDDASINDRVALQLRVPRTILGIVVGAALGLAGAILQGLTRNPLADPGIMGINAGAAASVVFAITVLGVGTISGYVWFAFGGAVVATGLVYVIGSLGREGATPVKMALAGAAVTAGLTSVTTGIMMSDVEVLDELRFWQVGSLAGRYAPIVTGIAPFLAVGIVGALLCGRALNGLALGDDTARSFGISVGRTRVLLLALVALLCGAGTAACGPIVFVGLVVPHVARFICGPDYRWILPYSMVLSPVLLLGADIIGRIAGSPGELQVGVVLGLLGAPFFIALVRYGRLSEL
jgi:iron complex transport system permease protein